MEVISICYNSYSTIQVGPIDMGLKAFKPSKGLRMRKAKDIIEATTDDGNLRSDLFEERNCTGTRTAMVRYKKHITCQIDRRVD